MSYTHQHTYTFVYDIHPHRNINLLLEVQFTNMTSAYLVCFKTMIILLIYHVFNNHEGALWLWDLIPCCSRYPTARVVNGFSFRSCIRRGSYCKHILWCWSHDVFAGLVIIICSNCSSNVVTVLSFLSNCFCRSMLHVSRRIQCDIYVLLARAQSIADILKVRSDRCVCMLVSSLPLDMILCEWTPVIHHVDLNMICFIGKLWYLLIDWRKPSTKRNMWYTGQWSHLYVHRSYRKMRILVQV
jgi:hypothetical protein